MRRFSLHAMLPVGLVLVLWVWFGRIVFGVGGWFFLILLPVAAVMTLALVTGTVLAYTRRARPRQLSGVQAVLQLLLWISMFGCGLFMPDFGDTDDSATSMLTQVFGYSDSLYDTSFVLAMAFGLLIVLLWFALLIALVVDRGEQAPVAGP